MATLRTDVAPHIARNCGQPLNYKPTYIISAQQIVHPQTVDLLLHGNNWSNVLGYFKNDLYARSIQNPLFTLPENDDRIVTDNDERKARHTDIDELLSKYREDIDYILPLDFQFEKLDNTPVGFSPSSPRSTVNYIFKLSLRERLLRDSGYLEVPYYFDDLLACLKAGHLPCGWDGPFPHGMLYVY